MSVRGRGACAERSSTRCALCGSDTSGEQIDQLRLGEAGVAGAALGTGALTKSGDGQRREVIGRGDGLGRGSGLARGERASAAAGLRRQRARARRRARQPARRALRRRPCAFFAARAAAFLAASFCCARDFAAAFASTLARASSVAVSARSAAFSARFAIFLGWLRTAFFEASDASFASFATSRSFFAGLAGSFFAVFLAK